jgi:chaperonin GroEL (HSP60 family)
MNKMVINHVEKLFVTNDAATIMREVEVNLYFQDSCENEAKFKILQKFS